MTLNRFAPGVTHPSDATAEENHLNYLKNASNCKKNNNKHKKHTWREVISNINKDTSIKDILNYIKRLKGNNHNNPIADAISEHFAQVSSNENYENTYRLNKIIQETN